MRRVVPRARRALAIAAGVALSCLPLHQAGAQGGYLVQGVLDAELWKTDSASALLARHGGRPATLGRLDLWAAVEPLRDLVAFAEGRAETGSARDEPGSEVYLTRAGIRYSPSDAFTVEAGKVQHVVGLFAARRLSFRNPLIGAPDGYSDVYPTGAVVSGTAGRVDYRTGMLSLPLTRDGYVPDPGARYRPAVGLGVTPVIGMRVGMSASVGSYLNRDIAAANLAGRDWRAYHQRIVAADVQLSRGYFEGNAEAARGSYDVPGAPAITGFSGYAEGKYTFAPRFYLAARLERNDYPYIAPLGNGTWVAARSAFSDLEAGGGYRVAPSTLLKLSVRGDRWTPSPNRGAPQANGHAVVMQLSQQFDVVELARGMARP